MLGRVTLWGFVRVLSGCVPLMLEGATTFAASPSSAPSASSAPSVKAASSAVDAWRLHEVGVEGGRPTSSPERPSKTWAPTEPPLLKSARTHRGAARARLVALPEQPEAGTPPEPIEVEPSNGAVASEPANETAGSESPVRAVGPEPPTEPGEAPATPEDALAIAAAAFEYRDFAQVVSALDPWVHPPRIRETSKMIAARRLLGVSQHELGNEREAREEFAQLLLLDPRHELDPFKIPPRIIATFEDVRRDLGPSLEVREPAVSGPSPVEVPHPLVAWLPFGIPQLALGEVGAGVLLGALQVVGLAVNVFAWHRGDDFSASDPTAERDLYLGLQYGGLGLFGIAYGVGVVHAHGLVEARRRAATALEAPPSAPASAFVPQIELRF